LERDLNRPLRPNTCYEKEEERISLNKIVSFLTFAAALSLFGV
jgi:hypothetical protein